MSRAPPRSSHKSMRLGANLKSTNLDCVLGGQNSHRLFCSLLRVLAIIAIFIVTQGHAFARVQWRHFVATAYSVSGETKAQTFTEEGRTVAADPSVLPIGTVIEVRNAGPYSGQYVVQDTGQKIVGSKIDIFISRTKEAMRFGRRNVRVRVLRPAPAAPAEQRRAAAEASIAPKPPKQERNSDYYQYPSASETASVQ